MFVAKFFHESEEGLCEIYSMNKENEKAKLKWILVLDTFPFYVVVYDRMKESISYINKHISSTLFPTQLFKENLEGMLNFK
jgi:hypothetical protein